MDNKRGWKSKFSINLSLETKLSTTQSASAILQSNRIQKEVMNLQIIYWQCSKRNHKLTKCLHQTTTSHCLNLNKYLFDEIDIKSVCFWYLISCRITMGHSKGSAKNPNIGFFQIKTNHRLGTVIIIFPHKKCQRLRCQSQIKQTKAIKTKIKTLLIVPINYY